MWTCSLLRAFVSTVVEALSMFYLWYHYTWPAKARALWYVLDQRLEEGPMGNVLGFGSHMVLGLLLICASGSTHRWRKTSLMKGSGCDSGDWFYKNIQLDLAKHIWVLIKYTCCPRSSSSLWVLDELHSFLFQVSTGVSPASGICRVFWS